MKEENQKLSLHRIAEFEQAQKELLVKGREIHFSEVIFLEDSRFVSTVEGTAKVATGFVALWWDRYGRAYISDSRMEEFDLPFDMETVHPGI